MNLRDLEYICAVAKTGHFGQAARLCHVSQPTLSGQIKKLEDYLGVTIFERARSGAMVTEAGREVIALAKGILSDANQIKSLANSYKDPFSGKISLGIIPTLAPSIIPHFVPALSKTFSQLSVSYEEDQTTRLVERLIKGELDLALLATPPEDDSLCHIDLFDEPFFLAIPKGHELEQHDSVNLSDIDMSELMLLNEGHCLRNQVLEICNTNTAAASQQALNASSLETLIRLTAAKKAMTLIPTLALGNIENSGLHICKLNDSNAFRTVNLTYRRSLPRDKIIKALAGIIVTHLPESVIPLYRI